MEKYTIPKNNKASPCWSLLHKHRCLWLLVYGTVSLSTLQVLQTFSLTQQGSLLSFLAATSFNCRPLTSRWRGKTHRNKQTKNQKVAKHKNTQPQHVTHDLLALHLPEITCFSSMIHKETDVQENCLLGPPFPSMSGSTLMITGPSCSINIY